MSLKANESGPDTPAPPDGLEPAQVRAQLDRILHSDSFASARRLSAFLRFVVESTLAGQEVKESLIGVEVYGRDATYNPKEDSIVRAEASRLRSKLRDYYDAAGSADPIRIELPKGSYVPVFHPRQVDQAPEEPLVSLPPPQPPPAGPEPSRSAFPIWALVTVALTAALVPAFWIIRNRVQSRQPTIAMIALRNAGPDTSLTPLAESWTSNLTKSLLRSGVWHVAGPSPAVEWSGPNPAVTQLRSYKADAVLTGTVRRLGVRSVRINLDLMNPADGYLIWHTTFDRDLLVANEVQESAAGTLVEEMTRRYTGSSASSKSRAYALARDLWSSFNISALDKSIRHFEEVTREDPNFAPAWAGLADAHLRIAEATSGKPETRDQVEAARRAAERALSIDETNAEGHTVLGRIHLYHDWNFSSAAEHLQRSLALDPTRVLTSVALSQVLTIRGDMTAALEVVQEARTRIPLLSELPMQEGSVYFLAKRYEKMEETGRELLRLEPGNSLGHWLVGLSLELRGKVPEAIQEFEAAMRSLGREDVRLQCALSHAYGAAGQRDKALAMMHRYYPDLNAPLNRFSLTYCVALVHASLGERGKALDWLEKSRQHRDMSFPFFASDARFDVLKEDPRYQALAAFLRR